jgi:hypothetical protein
MQFWGRRDANEGSWPRGPLRLLSSLMLLCVVRHTACVLFLQHATMGRHGDPDAPREDGEKDYREDDKDRT